MNVSSDEFIDLVVKFSSLGGGDKCNDDVIDNLKSQEPLKIFKGLSDLFFDAFYAAEGIIKEDHDVASSIIFDAARKNIGSVSTEDGASPKVLLTEFSRIFPAVVFSKFLESEMVND